LVLVLALASGDPGLGAQSKPLPISARVIAHGEFAGFGPFGPPHLRTFTNARDWVTVDTSLTAAQVSARVAALRKEGFVVAVSEQLGSLTPYRGGLSWVEQLGSPTAARTAAAATVSESRASSPGDYAQFAVPGVPGAV